MQPLRLLSLLGRCLWLAVVALMFSACALVQYQPVETISRIDRQQGYRLSHNLQKHDDDVFVILMFSGGGSRAAALGYGVLEELSRQKVYVNGRETTLMDSVDLVYGVSGGSVLAAYYAMYGKDTIPAFEQNFLKQNFQKQVVSQVFSLANLPRLTSPEFGRGDLLQEQFENTLFGNTTFGDLAARRKGPFAVISATDMSLGHRFDFTQEYFDVMCLNLSKLPVARAVAASSAVPLVFSPLTLNNHGGNCGYTLPPNMRQALADSDEERLQSQTRREFTVQHLNQYGDSRKRPYIHLIDGGLTDNLGLRSLLDASEIYPENMLRRQFANGKVHTIAIINVNAQNQLSSNIDQSAAVPGFVDVLNAVINVPIDQYSQESLRRFRAVADQWNDSDARTPAGRKIGMHFVSLNLRDLPDTPLRHAVLNISTSFQLPNKDVNNLKTAAGVLLQQSPEYARLLEALSAKPVVGPAIPVPAPAACHEENGEDEPVTVCR